MGNVTCARSELGSKVVYSESYMFKENDKIISLTNRFSKFIYQVEIYVNEKLNFYYHI